ncbi:MAG TPA: hypothetical protein VFW76_10425 [Ktedonobacterales bacterium]|nr:hypothetical protein [Ktedonobacterales bacterium]
MLIMPIALLALSLFGVLAGCDVGAPSGATKTTQTATARAAQAATAAQAAQATRAAEPVWTSISVQQEGTIAENNVSLNIAVTVTNRTSAPIHIHFTCGYPPVIVQVIPMDGQGILWTQDTVGCPSHATREDPNTIDPDSSYTFTYTAPISQYVAELGYGGFHPGDYQVIAKYGWHQGAIDQVETDPSLLYGKATGETTITLR